MIEVRNIKKRGSIGLDGERYNYGEVFEVSEEEFKTLVAGGWVAEVGAEPKAEQEPEKSKPKKRSKK